MRHVAQVDPPAQSSEPSEPVTDRTVFFYWGPLKPMIGEVILYSVAAITGHDFGAFDFTAPDTASREYVFAGNDRSFGDHCRLMGGCLEHRVPLGRRSALGTVYVLQLEKLVAEACYDRRAFGMFPGRRPPDRTVGIFDVIDHQYLQAFGTLPSVMDVARSREYFEAHLNDLDPDGLPPLESAGRGHCRALLASNRFLFY